MAGESFTCFTITTYLHQVEGAVQLQYGKEPVFSEIGELVLRNRQVLNQQSSKLKGLRGHVTDFITSFVTGKIRRFILKFQTGCLNSLYQEQLHEHGHGAL